MSGVDATKINDVVAQIEKQFGKGNIHSGTETQVVPRIPFTSVELNIATGGGAPIGRMSRFWGHYSSAKSLTTLNLIKNAQNLHIIGDQMTNSKYEKVKRRGEFLVNRFPNGMECILYNVEGAYDKVFANSIGVDTDRLFVVEGSKIEETGQKLEAALGAAHLHVIDSLSAAASVDELAAGVEDWHRGIKARSWNKVLDRFQHHIDKEENSIIMIDQARVNMVTGAEQPPGGNKIEHASSQTIHFKRGKWLYNRGGILKPEYEQNAKTLSGKAEADGMEVWAHVKKSRVGRPFRLAAMQVDFSTNNFVSEFELAKAAVFYEVVERGGAWYTLPSGEKVQGENKLREAIREDVELKNTIQDTIENIIAENP